MALKDELIQKALRRSKPNPKTGIASKYSHFKIYEVPPIENIDIKNKQYTNRTQTEHKLDTELNTNSTQTEHIKDADFDNCTQSVHANEHTVEHKPNTNQTQTEHKYSAKVQQFPFPSYVGLQRNILILFYYNCKTSRSRETQELTLQHVANSLNIRIGSVKTSIRRLEEKEAIKRIKFKNGRSGWSKYELQEHIYREIMHYEDGHKLDTKWLQTRHKLNTQPDTQPDTSLSSSSNSFNKNKTTTGVISGDSKLTEDWQAINIESLNNIGFTQTHLRQIAHQGKLPPDVVQASIHAFAFDLVRNKKMEALQAKNIPPLNYFMGVLRNGQPYAPPGNYESPEEEAMRLYVEKQQALAQQRAAVENAAIDLAFKEWLATLAEEEKQRLLSPLVRSLKTEQPKLAELKLYFVKEVWVTKRLEITQAAP